MIPVFAMFLIGCASEPPPPKPKPSAPLPPPAPPPPPEEWTQEAVGGAVIGFMSKIQMKPTPHMPNEFVEDPETGKKREIVLDRQPERAIMTAPDSARYLFRAHDHETLEELTLDFGVRWQPDLIQQFAVETPTIQAVDGRDRWRWVEAGGLWTKQADPCALAADWTATEAIRRAVDAWFDKEFGRMAMRVDEAPYGTVNHGVHSQTHRDEIVVIDEDTARWMVDGRGEFKGAETRLVLDYEIAWSPPDPRSGFVVRGVRVRAVDGRELYRWESDGAGGFRSVPSQ